MWAEALSRCRTVFCRGFFLWAMPMRRHKKFWLQDAVEWDKISNFAAVFSKKSYIK